MNKQIIDLRYRHFEHKHGNILVIGTWFTHPQDGQLRPCLALVPANKPISYQTCTPCIVPLDTASKWSLEVGDPADCARSCMAFAKALGMDGFNQLTLMRIHDAVNYHLGDLCSLPPFPNAETAVVADAYWTDENGQRQHKEIIDRV